MSPDTLENRMGGKLASSPQEDSLAGDWLGRFGMGSLWRPTGKRAREAVEASPSDTRAEPETISLNTGKFLSHRPSLDSSMGPSQFCQRWSAEMRVLIGDTLKSGSATTPDTSSVRTTVTLSGVH